MNVVKVMVVHLSIDINSHFWFCITMLSDWSAPHSHSTKSKTKTKTNFF